MFKHLHVVSCSPRSGTTLLHEVMVTCLEIDKHYDHEMRFNRAWAEGEDILLTKRPKDTLYVPRLLRQDPEFYSIYLLRDPRDVIVSRHGKNDSRYYVNVRVWRELHGIAKTLHGHPRFLQVKYEEFVRRPDDVQAEICARFPWLKSKHRFSAYHDYARVSAKSQTAMRGVRPIAPTSVGRWRDNLARVKGQQERHGSLTPDLIDCGYETSADWEQCLEQVVADRGPSIYPERLNPLRRAGRYLDAQRKIWSYARRRASLRASPDDRTSS